MMCGPAAACKLGTLPCLLCQAPSRAQRAADSNELRAGKFACLDRLLSSIVGQLHQRAVVCAQSTQLLDEAASLCASRGWSCVRIDGSTPAAKRGEIVKSFNTANIGQVLHT